MLHAVTEGRSSTGRDLSVIYAKISGQTTNGRKSVQNREPQARRHDVGVEYAVYMMA